MNDDVKVLPSDIWLEILRQIPAADLIPLKAVCKTFLRLISDDFFARLHLNHHLTNARRTIMMTLKPTPSHSNYDPDKRTINVRYDDPIFVDFCSMLHSPIHSHRVIDSYHGLLLVKICGRVLLCNPITRSFRLIPPLEMDFSKIAYDNVSKQYKVFGLERKSNRVTTLCVFDGKSNSPRKTDMELAGSAKIITMSVSESVLVNGKMHFLVTTLEPKSLLRELIFRNYVVSANVTTEEVKIRSCSSTLEKFGYFFAANGTFYQIEYNRELQLRVLDGVDSENPNPSWMIKHLIDIDRVISTLSMTALFDYRVVGMFGDKVLIVVVEDRDPNYFPERRLCQYDLSSKEFEQVTCNNIERELRNVECFHIVEHINSLIRL